jgi:hypothetical protein
MAGRDLSPAALSELDEPLLTDVQTLVEKEENIQDAAVVRVGWKAWLQADHSNNPLVHTSGFIFGQVRGWSLCAERAGLG